MDIELDTADRETLLALIAKQRATIDQLRRRVDALEARLSTRGKGMPGNKPSSSQQQPEKPPRKNRGSGFGRMRMTPTKQVVHALDVCPDCGTHLSGGWVQRTREVIDIPVVPAEVTEHVFVMRVCPRCKQRQMPKAEWGGGVVAGQQRLGTNVTSLIATLREDMRLPIETVQRYLDAVHQLGVSAGVIVKVIHRVARRAEPAVAAVVEQIRGSPVAHADETGWRQDGVNGYVWTFSTPTERCFLRRGRNKEVVDEVLDESFGGVLVSDFYAAYNHYPGLKQRCWAHLPRDIHDLKALYPEDALLARWADGTHQLYVEAKAFSSPKAKERRRAQLRLEGQLMALCRPFLNDPLAAQGKLCRRMERFREELFVFVAHPEVPADNNAAERSLRHLVTSRKISGGTRSARGTSSKMTLASLFGTWRARGLNPFHECRALLASPQV